MEEVGQISKLSQLDSGEDGVIVKVMGHGSFRKRITEMGFVRGKKVRVVKRAPMLDPIEYEIMGTHVALRRSEADMIMVATGEGAENGAPGPDYGELSLPDEAAAHPHTAGNIINIALVGNPNCGKTSLFNVMSGAKEHVGNYSGVTVSSKTQTIVYKGYTINISDLPGTYSLTEYTPEELYVRSHLSDQLPDVVINVVSASNLERNLYLTTQLIDMNLRVVIALNMYDELKASHSKLDYGALGHMIGIPMAPTTATRGKGITELLDKVIDVFEERDTAARHVHVNYGTDTERAILMLQDEIWKNKDITARFSSRYLALKLLENNRQGFEILREVPNIDTIRAITRQERARLEKLMGEPVEIAIADAKYAFIAGALSETYVPGKDSKQLRSSRIDGILTNRYLGLPIFFIFMWVMFQTTFSLGQYPADWIGMGVGALSSWLGGLISDPMLRDLIVGGIINGMGGVLVFLPNILILFFFISIMEDSGYMARTAFIMDRAMHKIGLHGKSFIPLLMGFGCNVPAIMATRTLQSRKDRVLTMLIIPFMSCSARLPVFILLISTFFVKNQGLVLLSLYFIGILLAILSALLLKNTIFRKQEAPFVMELPSYRVPTLRSVASHMWNKGAQYLRKIGTVILLASIIIWGLGYFPLRDGEPSAERLEHSYIGRIGHAIEPIVRPMGFDWRIGASLVSGLAAKEIVVSSMAVISHSDDDVESLGETLRKQTYTSGPRQGEKVYTPLVAYALMVFILLYFPCIGVIATIRKEAGGGWAAFTVFYTTAVAWLMSFVVYQIGSLL